MISVERQAFGRPVGQCAGRDSNPHRIAPTAPSTLRVYQFRHPRVGLLVSE